jgi:hypothetical protein
MKKRNNWLVFGLIFLCMCFFAFNTVTYGAPENETETTETETTEAETTEDEVKVEEKQISGEIANLSPRGAPVQIAVCGKEDNTDYYFKIAEDVKLENKRDLKQFSPGDTVGITYEEITVIKKNGKQEISRIATQIQFISPAKTGLRSGD